MKTLWQDIRYGLRVLARNPGFTTVAVLILALGIGASTAIFSVVNIFVLNPVPLPDQERLGEINTTFKTRSEVAGVSPKAYLLLEEHPELFEQLTAFKPDALAVAGGDFIDSVSGCKVTPTFFAFFRTQPALGRCFSEQDGRPGQRNALIISDMLWDKRFGRAPDVIGRMMTCEQGVFEVIGVMPATFRFPDRQTQYWRPFQLIAAEVHQSDDRNYTGLHTFARMRAGASVQQAQALLDVLSERLESELPPESQDLYKGLALRLRPIHNFFVDSSVRRTIWMLAGAIGFVLLITCANLANLQLARAEPRLREISVRTALGAGRWRIFRQFLMESLLLSLVGGSLGLAVAWWGSKLLSLLVPSYAPMLRPLGVDPATLAWTFALSAGSGIVFGLYPAWYASHSPLGESLKESGPHTSAVRSQRFFQNSVVVGEVALAVVLLVGGALMIQSVLRVLRVNPGFDPRHLAHVRVYVPEVSYQAGFDHIRARLRELAARLTAMPGTSAVGSILDGFAMVRHAEGNPKPLYVYSKHVGVGEDNCFKVLRVPLIEGRWFEEDDARRGRWTILVNQTFARMFWPGQSAVGKSLEGGYEVIGVVGDFDPWSYTRAREPTMYEPFERQNTYTPMFYVRSSLDPASFRHLVHQAVRDVFPPTVEPEVDWVQQQLYASTFSRRLYTYYLCAFAAAGLVLAGLGIFGVLAYSVTRRTREIGIRMALGARDRDVLTSILVQGLRLTLVGIVVGLVGACLLSRAMSSFLYGVSPTDPLTLSCVVFVAVAVALVASYVPARRAARIDPMVALRYE